MHRSLRLAVVSPCLLIVLVAAAVFPITALADDIVPPPPEAETSAPEGDPAPEETEIAPSEAAPTEPAAEADLGDAPPLEAATETAPTETLVEVPPTDAIPPETPVEVANESPVTAPAAVEVGPTEVPPLPPETDLVVVNSSGEAVPLATTEAAEIIATVDPVWCPDGESPGGPGCTYTSYDPDTNTYTGYPDLHTLVDYLKIEQPDEPGTIWVEAGDDASTSVIEMNAWSSFDTMEHYALTIQGGWDGNFDEAGTISGTTSLDQYLLISSWEADITLNDLIVSNTTQNGVHVSTTGDISLNGVSATLNEYGGAYLDNCMSEDGACTGNGDVYITDSSFNLNQPHDVPVPPDLPPVTSDGLRVWTAGDITLAGVEALENQGLGARLTREAGTGTVSVYGSEFTSNFLEGLIVEASGPISLTEVTADANGQFGYYAEGTEGSRGTGAILDNCLPVDGDCTGIGGIAVVDSDFNNNYQDGLDATSTGSIFLSGTSANDNGNLHMAWGAAGASLMNDYEGATGSIFVGDGSFSGNYGVGLRASSLGDIILEGVSVDGNGQAEDPYDSKGAILENGWYHSAGTISVDDSTFNDNYSTGLSAQSFGDITLTQVDATGNGLDRTDEPSAGNGATLDNCAWVFATELCDGSGSVLIEDSTFSGNLGDGVEVFSLGAITLDTVDADDNGIGWNLPTWGLEAGHGALLSNAEQETPGSFPGAVTVTGPSSFSGNYLDGLRIFTFGDILISDTTASNNGVGGEEWSGGVGISARTEGDTSIVSLTDVTVNDNLATGAAVGTWGGSGDVTLTNITGVGNGKSGTYAGAIDAFTGGNIIVDPGIFANNSGIGVNLDAGGDILVDCNYFADNGDYDLMAWLDGTLTLSGNTFAGNGYHAHAGGGVVELAGCGETAPSAGGGGSGEAGGEGGAALPPTTSGLAYNTVNVGAGDNVSLDCGGYAGTILMLQNGDHAVLPCPLSDAASLKAGSQGSLPAALDGGLAFLSAMEIELGQAGQSPQTLDATLGLHFIIPAGQQGANLNVLHWDGGQWEKLGGVVSVDGYFEAPHNETGLFVLVSG